MSSGEYRGQPSNITRGIWDGLTQSGPMPDDTADSEVTRGIRMMMRFKWLPVLGVIAGLCLAILYLLTATPLYTARMVLGPAETATGLSSAAGGLKAQLNMLVGDSGGTSVDPYNLFNELITSANTGRRLYDRGVLQMLYPTSWDGVTHSWLRPNGIKTFLVGSFHLLFGRPFWPPPGPTTVADMLKTDVNGHADNGSLYFRV